MVYLLKNLFIQKMLFIPWEDYKESYSVNSNLGGVKNTLSHDIDTALYLLRTNK